MENILQVKSLTKMFGQNYAVDNVDMNIYRGDIYGFIGRNGAGKTTLIRILLGLCEKNSGEVELFGSTNLLEGRDKIGCIIENPAVFPKMTARENIIAQSKAVGVNLSETEIAEILKTARRTDRSRSTGATPPPAAPGEAGMVTAEIAVALPAVVLVLLLVLSAVSAGVAQLRVTDAARVAARQAAIGSDDV